MFVVIGTTTIDLVVAGMNTMPRLEGDEFTSSSLVFCKEPLLFSLGGNGANSAYVLAAMGDQVALCSAAGRDHVGNLAANWLQEKGVDMRGFVRSMSGGSATTTAVMDQDANRLSFYYPGPLETFSYDHVPADLLGEARVLLVTGWPLLPGFREDGFLRAFTAAHEKGAMTALDIGPAIRNPVHLAEIAPVLPLVDYLITNEYELSICTGTDSLDDALVMLLEAGANHIVVKRGREGALAQTPDMRVEAGGFPVQSSSTIGAGDSFNAGFLHSLNDGASLEQALLFGNATAALVLSSGSVLGAPSLEQINTLIAEQQP